DPRSGAVRRGDDRPPGAGARLDGPEEHQPGDQRSADARDGRRSFSRGGVEELAHHGAAPADGPSGTADPDPGFPSEPAAGDAETVGGRRTEEDHSNAAARAGGLAQL